MCLACDAPEPVSNLFRLTLRVKSEGAGESVAEHTTNLSSSLAPPVKPIRRSAVSRPEQTYHNIHSTATCNEQAECCVGVTQSCGCLVEKLSTGLFLEPCSFIQGSDVTRISWNQIPILLSVIIRHLMRDSERSVLSRILHGFFFCIDNQDADQTPQSSAARWHQMKEIGHGGAARS